MKKKDRRFILGLILTFVGYNFSTSIDWLTQNTYLKVLNVIIFVMYTGIMFYGINQVSKNS